MKFEDIINVELYHSTIYLNQNHINRLIISSYLKTDKYPIHLKKDDERYIKLVANLRAKFCQEGIVTLPGFLRLSAIPDITKVFIMLLEIFHFTLN